MASQRAASWWVVVDAPVELDWVGRAGGNDHTCFRCAPLCASAAVLAVSVASQLLARGAIFLATPPAISAVVSWRALCLLQQRWLSAGDSHVRHVVWFRYGPTDSRAIGFGQIAVGWRACGTCALSAHPPAKRGACRAWSVGDHTFPNSRETSGPQPLGRMSPHPRRTTCCIAKEGLPPLPPCLVF